jgi:DNA primase
MGIADDDIAKVRAATDIVAVISEHLQLRRVGQRWTGLCPFHNEKSPSFSVNQQMGFYHCFGCQRSGDAITFVREIEGLDFVGAVERLAGKAGVTLTYTSADEGKHRRRRAQLVDAVAEAVEWYHRRLLEAHDAGAARAYLRSRGISGDEVRTYKVGWAPDDWDLLTREMRSRKVPDRVLAESGLAFTNKANRLQDTFRARILFPIYDVNNDPVGFGGRKLPEADGPKYKNSSESSIYAKSRLLYGLNWAKEHVVRADEVVVCEGYTDVMGYAKAGVPRAVATCGTALTEEHVKILKRFASRIVLSFDADAAGQAAADKFYEWEKRYDIDVRVAALPPGVDPGDLAQRDPEALAAAVEEAQPFLGFRVARVLEAADLATVEGRARAAEAATALVAAHPSELVRDQYLMQIAGRCGVEVARLRTMGNRSGRQREAPSAEPVRVPTMDSVEMQVLRVAVHRPDLVPGFVDTRLLADPVNQRVFETLLVATSMPDALDSLLDAGDDVAHRRLAEIMAVPPDDGELDGPVARRLAGQLVHEAGMRRVRELGERARRTDDPALGPELAALKLALDGLREASWEMPADGALAAWLESSGPVVATTEAS